jgi:hypothetical protein
MKDLALRAPVSLAVAYGATTPVPATGERPIIWSTTENAFLHWNGTIWVYESDIYVPLKNEVHYQIEGTYTDSISAIGTITTVVSDTVTTIDLSSIYFDNIYSSFEGVGARILITETYATWNPAAIGVYEVTAVTTRSNISVRRATGWEAGKLIRSDTEVKVLNSALNTNSFLRFETSAPDASTLVADLLYSANVDTVGDTIRTHGGAVGGSFVMFRDLRVGASLPSPLTLNTLYYNSNIISNIGVTVYNELLDVNTFRTTETTRALSLTDGGVAINLTTSGTNSAGPEYYICKVLSVSEPSFGVISKYTCSGVVGTSSVITFANVVEDGAGGPLHESPIILGNGSVANGYSALAIGGYVYADSSSVAVGHNSTATNASIAIKGTAIGSGSIAIAGETEETAAASISLGGVTKAPYSTAVGYGARTYNNGEFCTTLGSNIQPTGDTGIIISRADISKSPILGYGATPSSEFLIFQRLYSDVYISGGGISIEILPSRVMAFDYILNDGTDPGVEYEYSAKAYYLVTGDTFPAPATAVITGSYHQRIVSYMGDSSEGNNTLRIELTYENTNVFGDPNVYANNVHPVIRIYGKGLTYWYGEINVRFTDTSAYSAINFPLMSPISTSNVIKTIASETLTAGQVVNLFNSAGVAKIRKADKSNGRRADGYILQNYVSNDTAYMYVNGENPYCSGLTVGDVYLSTAGGYSSTPGSTGHLSQRVGFALSTSKLLVQLGEPIQNR